MARVYLFALISYILLSEIDCFIFLRSRLFPSVKIIEQRSLEVQDKFFSPRKALLCAPVSVTPEKFQFETNVAKVMDIIINSLYSNKDVFIRELVSNAADACDKKRFAALTNGMSAEDMKIRVSTSYENNTLTIADAGIGMNKAELVQNLGHIAESGTKRFMENNKNSKDDLGLIGQFGVGFYSGFLVANRIEVITKGTEGQQLRWEASADKLNEYSIVPDNSEPIEGTGTKVILHLKDECDMYLDDLNVGSLLEKYSEFVPFPIEMLANVTKPESVVDTSAPPEADGTLTMKTVMRRKMEWKLVNSKKPLWLRPPKECTHEEYESFYQQTFKAHDKLLAYSHFNVEGNVDFKAMIFLPSEIPYELTRDMFSPSARSLRLYVRRVFINDKFEDMIPRWLLFMRGVVDSDDLPLNVGREILQQSRALRIIKQRLVKKGIEMMSDVAFRDAKAYEKFWRNFGKYIKLGLIEDSQNRDELIPLCRFYTSQSDGNTTNLVDYVRRMPFGQESIYYVVGETRAQAANSPSLEKLRQKGYEVIYLTEPLDEMMMQNIEKYQDKPIVDAGKEFKQDLSSEEVEEKKRKSDDSEGLRYWMKNILGNKITRVEASTRLVDSPATIVQSEYGVSPAMQKYLRAQAMDSGSNDSGGNAGGGNNGIRSDNFNQAVLEINPDHTIIQHLSTLHKESQDSEDAKELVDMVFQTAALSAGYILDNSADYSKMVVKMLTKLVS